MTRSKRLWRLFLIGFLATMILPAGTTAQYWAFFFWACTWPIMIFWMVFVFPWKLGQAVNGPIEWWMQK